MTQVTKEQYAQLKTDLEKAQGELDFVLADKTKMKGRAVEIMEKMQSEWTRLYKWMDKMHLSAEQNYFVEAPHGRRRHLFGMMVPSKMIQAALKRRAVNAPAQGFSADVGHTAARLYDIHMHMFCRKFNLIEDDASFVPGAIECAVHDALIATPTYKMVLVSLQIKHWAMTVGVCEWFADYYDHQWLTPPEIETEIGWHEANMSTWNFTLGTEIPEKKEKEAPLRECFRRAVQDQFDNGIFPKGVTVDKVMKEIMEIPEEWQKHLDRRYAWFATPSHMS